MNTRFFFLLALVCLYPVIFNDFVQAENTEGSPTIETNLKAEKVGLKTDDNVVEREAEAISPEGFSVKEQQLIQAQAEHFQFQAEVNKLMHIIINSLYSQNEIFLRELISNASDALDKIRFLSLTDAQQLDSGATLDIRIKADSEAKTLTITDTGIGMSKQDLINNLGTIAQSGTTEFLKKFSNAGDNNLIGQFGVGFYSVFLVADKVTVISKNNEDKQYIWQSDAQGAFTVSEDPRGSNLKRGTSIILHLKEESEEFLEEERLKGLVQKYSQFINFPIYVWASHEEEKEVNLTEEEIEA